MKTLNWILVVYGFLLYLTGIVLGGNDAAGLLSLLGGFVLVGGLFPQIDKWAKKWENRTRKKSHKC